MKKILLSFLLLLGVAHADTFDFSYIFANGIDSVTGTVTGTQQGDSVTGTILNPVVTSVVFDGVVETAAFSNYAAVLAFPQGGVSGTGSFSFSTQLTDIYLEPWITYRVFYLFGDQAKAGVYDTYYSILNPTTPILQSDNGTLGTWTLTKEQPVQAQSLFFAAPAAPSPVPERAPTLFLILAAFGALVTPFRLRTR